MKRGQVTIFMIVGITFVILFVFLMFVSNNLSDKNLSDKQKEILGVIIQSTPLQNFVSTCVEDALESGLVRIGEQGGLITLGTRPSRQFSNTNVLFGIVNALETSNPKKYPCYTGNPEATCRYPDSNETFRFGNVVIPSLGQSTTSTSNDDSPPDSIKRQLENYITDYVKGCVNLIQITELASLSGYDISFDEDDVYTIVQIENSGVSASVHYPIKIGASGQEVFTQFVEFDSQSPVRLSLLIDALYRIAYEETHDLSFDFSIDSLTHPAFAPLSEGVSLKKANTTGKDDVFIFNDSISRINNESYVFIIARENRPPVLDYISRYPSSTQHDNYDYLAFEGENITITLNAADPDEDQTTISASGLLSNQTGGTVFILGAPPVGEYTQRFSASDGFASDAQDVRIIVDPVLRPTFKITDDYDDVADGVVSREDYFYFDASGTNQTLDAYADYNFSWRAMISSLNLDYACAVFPSYTKCGGALPEIENINLAYEWGDAANSNSFQIDLFANLTYDSTSQNASATRNIAIAECLPHRNTTDPYPYPYNLGDNPYLADHACCEDDIYTFSDTDKVCFRGQQCVNGSPYLSEIVRFCSGDRGNTCTGDFGEVVESQPRRCGYKNATGCSINIAESCQGEEPWRINSNNGWCYSEQPSDSGCEDVCTSEIVDSNGPDSSGDGVFGEGDSCKCAPGILGFGDSGKACQLIGSTRSGTCSAFGACNPR